MIHLIKPADDLSTKMFLTCGVVVHDTLGGGDDEVAELAGGEELGGVGLDIFSLYVEGGGHGGAFVDTSLEVDDSLSAAGIIDEDDIIDIVEFLHHLEEGDHFLSSGSDEDLTLAGFFSIEDAF